MLNIAVFDLKIKSIDELDALLMTGFFSRDDYYLHYIRSFEEYLKFGYEQQKKYDIIFLRIENDGDDGFKIAEYICKNTVSTEIVFVCRDASFAMQGYRYRAMGYLVDPISDRDMLNICRDYYLTQSEDYYFEYRIGNTIQSIKTEKIKFICSNGRKLTINNLNDDIEYYGKLDDIEAQLSEKAFVRIHQSYLVNTAYIKTFSKDKICLLDGSLLPISRNRVAQVCRKLSENHN